MAQSNIVNSTRIERLNKHNYDTWWIQVEAILIKNDAWGYVHGDIPEPTVVESDAPLTAAHNRWIKADS